MKWHDNCRYMEIPRDYSVRELAKFHGHLGPFIVLGYRMGRFAIQYFGDNPFDLFATVYCSGKPPESCIVDGVQLGSGCTFGKRNIELIVSNQISVVFRHVSGKSCILMPSTYISQRNKLDGPDKEVAIENFAEEMYSLPDDMLFSVEDI